MKLANLNFKHLKKNYIYATKHGGLLQKDGENNRSSQTLAVILFVGPCESTPVWHTNACLKMVATKFNWNSLSLATWSVSHKGCGFYWSTAVFFRYRCMCWK